MTVKKMAFHFMFVTFWSEAKSRIFFSAAVLALLVAISSYINYPSFNAWYGPIDDHDFLQLSNPSGMFDILRNVHQYFFETGGLSELGSTPRYTPVYYVLRAIVILTLGEHPGFLYFLRACSQALCSFLIYLICTIPLNGSNYKRNQVRLVAFITSMLALASPSWVDISTRLGPSEVELSIGICFTIIGLFNLANSNTTENRKCNNNFIALLVGVCMASGSKENGLVSVVALGYILFTRRNWIKQKKWRIISATIGTIIPSAVAYNVICVMSSGSDVYGNSRNSDTVFVALIERAQDTNFLVIVGSAILVALNYLLTKSSHGRGATVVVLFLVVLYLSEGIFYSNIFVPLRYGLLSDLALLLSIGIFLANQISSKSPFLERSNPKVAIAVASVLFFGIYLFSPFDNFRTHFVQSKANSDYTNDWKLQILPISKASVLQPNNQIVIYEQNSESDYERIASIVKFLKFMGSSSDVFLIVLEPEDKSNVLLSSLWNTSVSGSEKWGLDPLNKLNWIENSICISFFDDPRITGVASSFNPKITNNCSTFHVISA